MKTKAVVGIVLLLGLLATNVPAEEQQAEQMPPMGAPEQMKKIAFLEGTWDVAMEWRNDEDTSVWDKSTAECTYKSILDGCAMQMIFTGAMMDMPFQGYMLQSFDREKNEWQALWIDNMGGRMTLYTGSEEKDGTVLTAKDVWQGQKFLSRMTTLNESPGSFDWTMETSFDNGQNWLLVGTARYVKRQ
ncbi:MAG: DUF1579 family protein [Candidatus Zixiibacteriota bacterium]|nr:MAG: DUF1579 family protein [candidate division Zixibacteria bacterium]